MQRLAQEIQNQRERPEMKEAGGKELVKEALRSFSRTERDPGAAAADAGAAPAADGGAQSPLPAYAQNAPTEVKLEIEYLLDVALRHGLDKAFAEAKKSPSFVQDALHDALAGRLYGELQKRGVVK